jgi:hypothetical protein
VNHIESVRSNGIGITNIFMRNIYLNVIVMIVGIYVWKIGERINGIVKSLRISINKVLTPTTDDVY